MSLAHVRFRFTLELLADLHIGTGAEQSLSALRPRAGRAASEGEAKEGPRVALVARDHAGRPFLPPTALKGALRKAFRAEAADVSGWFGEIKEGDAGQMGRFAFYGGRAEPYRAGADLPLWSETEGTYLATGVAIDRDSSTADHRKLFTVEMVPAGSRFEVEGTWFGPRAEAERNLPILLSPFAAKGGLALGSGGRNGLGRARLDPCALEIAETRFDPAMGEVVSDTRWTRLTVCAPPQKAGHHVRLALHCPGPFASVDPQRGSGNRIGALRRDAATPVLRPESIAGVLRARAAWLCAAGGSEPEDRFRKPSSWKTPAELQPVERLFGVSGFRGLLRIAALEPTSEPQPDNDLTSIALDRFTGAVLESTLFVHEAYVNVGFDLDLNLETRVVEGVTYPLAADTALFKELLDDLDGDVLLLGHATNRGFGWFDVKRVKGAMP
ncbi:RAMP superfamily CRISPR-associated protein [Methylorubrum podarium]|jgi:CRISPR/Cas system CSM-associated protein Csm3 (group 7 of RAMP superfamily)|uniref:RAMP superfamily CRISPR-associated protein n=1 Tax=Methylorubrum podarium TaxID=200476 RepID=UPI001EE3486B|nr:RAMP superfamily CRISPR-associated protein [Methylorubrum podarium]GJE68830.1 hypothetical protein CHKEEEPN_0352 [Methylorubrum podarium]